MRLITFTLLFFLTACGGKSSSSNEKITTDTLIFLSTSNNDQLVSKNITLTWVSEGMLTCRASGDWSGDKPLNGTEEVQVSKIGINTFTLTCFGEGNRQRETSVEVEGYITERRSIQQAIGNTNVNREFFIRYPEQPVENLYPVVFVFHGAGGNGEQELNRHQNILNLIDQGEFIGIFPSGFDNRWNVSGETNADDTEFFNLIVNELNTSSIFNTNRIFAIGISNGGGMVNKIGKETDLLSGIAPLISQQSEPIGNLSPGRPISVYQVNGETDDLVPIEGGPGVAGTVFMSAQGSAENWASYFSCNMMPSEANVIWGNFEVLEFTFSGCTNGVEIKYFIVKNSGHNLQFENQINLFGQIWDFFVSTTN